MNSCFLIGNLTKDPEGRTTANRTMVTNFTIAVQRRFKPDEADFIPVVTWRKQAENCAKYLKKGSQVAATGSIQTRSYDAQDGSKRTVTELVADEVKFLNRVGESDRSSQERQERTALDSTAQQTAVDDMPEEDLPF